MKAMPKTIRRRMCQIHRRYMAYNCPLCDQAIKAMLEKELP